MWYVFLVYVKMMTFLPSSSSHPPFFSLGQEITFSGNQRTQNVTSHILSKIMTILLIGCSSDRLFFLLHLFYGGRSSSSAKVATFLSKSAKIERRTVSLTVWVYGLN